MTHPNPFPRAPRIPEDQPFIVRPSRRKRAVLFGILFLVVLLVIGCGLGVGLIDNPDPAPVIIMMVLIGVFLAALFAFQMWLVTSGGPVLAMGPAGLWIKTRPTRGQAIWLPWEAIGLISRRRWSMEKMLCVKPRDPRAESDLGVYTTFDTSLTKAFFGTGFTATLNFADRPEAEILQAVAYYANGRVHLT